MQQQYGYRLAEASVPITRIFPVSATWPLGTGAALARHCKTVGAGDGGFLPPPSSGVTSEVSGPEGQFGADMTTIGIIGFDAVNIGPLSESWRAERDRPAYVVWQNAAELAENLAKAPRPV